MARKRQPDWTRRTIAGPVKITHADGTTEVQPAYGRGEELGRILNDPGYNPKKGRKRKPPTGEQPR